MTGFLLRNAYVLLFAASLTEQLGAPIPASPLLLGAGALAKSGRMALPQIIVLSVLASMLGHAAWFWAGRKRGGSVLRLICRISIEPDSCVRRTEDLFHAARRARVGRRSLGAGARGGRAAARGHVGHELEAVPGPGRARSRGLGVGIRDPRVRVRPAAHRWHSNAALRLGIWFAVGGGIALASGWGGRSPSGSGCCAASRWPAPSPEPCWRGSARSRPRWWWISGTSWTSR